MGWYSDNLVEKAVQLRFEQYGEIADQPGRTESATEEYGDESYVVLRNTKGILGVYRVDEGDQESPLEEIELTKLEEPEEWPEELLKEYREDK
jgi:hypothetical protein